MTNLPAPESPHPVAAQFVQVGERRVLVRHAGRGPAVVLLHQSPQSSAALAPWVQRLSERYAVFAPDTPGFGLSDPLPLAQPTIPDLARALAALLQALGLQRVLLYGVHTGASIAARLALDEPGRVAGLVCDGLALFTAEERQPLLDGYLPPFEPAWDGSHLLWLWARVREQTLFFPWHQAGAANRLPLPLSSPQKIHAEVLDLLAAGDGYRAGYRAPLMYEHGRAGAARLRGPAWLLYRDGDPLRPHLGRHAALRPGVQATSVPDAAALAAHAEAAFAGWAAQEDAVDRVDAAVQVAAAAHPLHRRVATRGGALGLRAWPGAGTIDGQDAVTRVLLPDIGQCVDPALALDPEPDASAAPAGPTPPTLAVEWPGHGASDRWTAGPLTLPALLDALAQALDAWPVGALTLQAEGGACSIAAALAQRLGARCRGLTLIDPLPLQAGEAAQFLAGLPTLPVHATGAHLLEAWNWARLAALFRPWMVPGVEAVVPAGAPPPRRVHAQVLEMLRAGPDWAALWRLALAPAAIGALQAARVSPPCPTRFRQRAGDPARQALLRRLGHPSPSDGSRSSAFVPPPPTGALP